MRKTALALALIILVISVCGCGNKTESSQQAPAETAAQTEAPATAETEAPAAPETEAAQETQAETAAPEKAAVTVDRFIGSWGAERSGWDIEKTGDDTVKVTYHGSNSAREGRDGTGTGKLKDGVLYVDMEYSDYIYASGEGPECARFVIGTCTDIFTPAEAMPSDYECMEGECFYVNKAVNVTPDKMEIYLGNELPKPENYLHFKGDLVNNNGKASEYICWYSDQIILTEDEISWMDKEQLRIARNEIYARHGRKFDSADLQERFNSCSWYRGTVDPDKFDDSVLSEVEKKNLKTIEKIEATK